LAKFDSLTVRESNQPMSSEIWNADMATINPVYDVDYSKLSNFTGYCIVYITMMLYYKVAKSKGFNSKQKYQGGTH